MGSVVEFGNVKKKQLAKEKKCRPPIEVVRINPQAILVKFRKTLFDGARLSCVVENLFVRQDYWRLFPAEEPTTKYYDEDFYGFIISVVCSDTYEKEYALNQAYYLMQHEAYRSEAQLRFLKDYAVSELAGLKRFNAPAVPLATVKTLNKANIFTLYDLALLTREELCGVPGMTTGEVYQIERALASLGWYLTASQIPSC